jgi:hypothetical protein
MSKKRYLLRLLPMAFLLAVPACEGAGASRDRTELSASAIIGGVLDVSHASVVGVSVDAIGPYCTGTVISKRTVLTAGHCVQPPDEQPTEVWFGANLFQPEHKIKIARSKRHPGYSTNGGAVAHDLAVLELASDAPVQPSPLLRATLDNSPKYVGKDFTFVGYGITNAVDHTNPDGSRHVGQWPVTAVGTGVIPLDHERLPASNFLSVSPTENLCNGDSGGPAFFVSDGVEYEAGVASTVVTAGSCTDGSVSSRCDQPEIDAFVQQAIDEFEHDDPCRSDGTCNESCTARGEIGDPDCAANHCQRDGVCAHACVAPIDPDCGAP